MPRTRSRLFPAVAALATVAVLLSGCSVIDGLTGSDDASATASASPTATETPYDSQFTRDGTFQSHIDVNGLDFVYTLYPTKSTPRTNEWYPKGNKFFSFTFQAYDLDRSLRDRFATKRKVYLEHITVTSETKTTDGGRVQHPYQLDVIAKDVTFDPEPLTTRYGMIITSPKGAFELRNQKIRGTSPDTRGIDLLFTATVWIQETPGSTRFYKKVIRQKVPIAIFESDQPTEAQPIPVDAN
ncbi:MULTISPECIES: hypothetical protein [unclassified Nocardioides]|uniref:hypothetical protein n=1 Tax=unclassified Nocardioides TaxID=2615069 RepID=UPI0000570E35|nr:MULTISPECIES: hypothetical protein [unclassified Nocardioides]ABL82998.1 hypothetical protein Noca_3498 [Nocardioides sp. JS614]